MLILCIFSYLFFDEKLAIWLSELPLPKFPLKLLAFPFGPQFHMAFWPVVFLVFRQRIFLQLGATLSIGGLTLKAVKLLLGRARPYLLFSDGITGLFGPNMHDKLQSMPSGHAFAAMALAMSVAYFYPKWKWPLLTGSFVIGLIRVSLNLHYLSDALAGMALAILTAKLVYINLNHLEKGFYYVTTQIRLRYLSSHSKPLVSEVDDRRNTK